MPLHETNPFRAAAAADAQHSTGSNNPFASASTRQQSQQQNSTSLPTTITTTTTTTTTTSARPTTQPSMSTDSRPPSPAPLYSRLPPAAHVVVGRHIVETMPVTDGFSVDTKDAPPSYFAHMVPTPAKPAPGFDIRDPSRRGETRFSEMFTDGPQRNGIYEMRGDIGRQHEARDRAEAQRQALERSNARRQKVARASGIWGCFRLCWPKGPKTAGQNKTFRIVSIILGVLIFIVVAVMIGVFVPKNRSAPIDKIVGRPVAQMHVVEGFPPLPTGVTVMSPADGPLKRTVCVKPAQVWSCDMPRPAPDAIPEFLFDIRHRDEDALRDAPQSVWAPRPEPADNYKAVAKFDGVRIPAKLSPFVISMQNKHVRYEDHNSGTVTTPEPNGSPVKRTLKERRIYERRVLEHALIKRQSIADPSRDPSHMLPSVLRNQPLHLVDAGLPSEHYTTHVYFDKSIFLDSINLRQEDARKNTEVPGTSSNANFACVWYNTRFKVQIWTRSQDTRTVIDRNRNQLERNAELFGKGGWMTDELHAWMPYPVTVTEDREVGGQEGGLRTNLACYNIVANPSGVGKLIDWSSRQTRTEMPAKDSSDGCLCKWDNSRERMRGDGPQ